MKVLGIDPGTAACGYGIVHESDGRLRGTCHGWWHTEASAKKLIRLIEALEDNDDVQEVSANFDIPEQVLEAVAS